MARNNSHTRRTLVPDGLSPRPPRRRKSYGEAKVKNMMRSFKSTSLASDMAILHRRERHITRQQLSAAYVPGGLSTTVDEALLERVAPRDATTSSCARELFCERRFFSAAPERWLVSRLARVASQDRYATASRLIARTGSPHLVRRIQYNTDLFDVFDHDPPVWGDRRARETDLRVAFRVMLGQLLVDGRHAEFNRHMREFPCHGERQSVRHRFLAGAGDIDAFIEDAFESRTLERTRWGWYGSRRPFFDGLCCWRAYYQ